MSFTPVEGLDVSRYQGPIDWPSLRRHAREISFCMVRLGEWRPAPGEAEQSTHGLADEQAERNLWECRRAAIVPGGYLRANPVMNSPEKEAIEFATRMHGFGVTGAGNMIPCLDMEDTSQQWGEWLREFITVWREVSPVWRLRVYSSGSFFNLYYGGVTDLDEGVTLLVADWSAPAGLPKFKPASATIHQYSNGSTLPIMPGLTGPVDRQRVVTGRRLVDAMI